MNWFRQHPFWGPFGVIGGSALLVALGLLWWTKTGFSTAAAEFRESAGEQRRLEAANPYPSEVNVRKMKVHLENYRVALEKLKSEVKTHVLPITPAAPNEFQTRLRQTIAATVDRARAQRVKLPPRFYLGFDEFVAALPKAEDAPKLDQQLAQIHLLLDLLIDAHVDAVTMFRRTAAVPAIPPSNTPTPVRGAAAASPAPKMVERATVDFTVSGAPSVIRKAINEISTANQQFLIIRTLHIKNQKDKGPPREAATGPQPANVAVPGASATPTPAIQFIVGEEHVDLSARVELVNFTF